MDWKATLADAMAERQRELGERPLTEELIAFRAGELSDDERERLIEHASWDPDVARELFDLLRFPEFPDDAATVTSGPAQDRTWLALRARLQSEGILPETARPSAPSPEPQREHPRPWWRLWLPLTASFSAGAILAFAIGELRSPVQVNLPIVELVAFSGTATDVRRGGGLTVLPASSAGIVLTLAAPGLAADSGPFDLEIRRGGQEVSESKGLVPGAGGVFVLLLPRDRLEAGAHELLLRDGRGKPVASFRLELELDR